MRLDLDVIRDQLQEEAGSTGDAEDEAGAKDEGEPVGDVGRDPAQKSKGKKERKGESADQKAERKRKVKVGRGLGVGELVEKNESKH